MPQEINLIKSTAERILSHPTWDLVLVFALLAMGFFYGISAGKRRMAVILIYTYVALAVFSSLPLEKLANTFGTVEIYFIKIGVFLAIFLLLAFFLGSRSRRGMATVSSWWEIFLLSFLQAGLLIHINLSFLPVEKIKLLAPLTKNLFANPQFHLWWLVIPIAVLIFLRRLETRDE